MFPENDADDFMQNMYNEEVEINHFDEFTEEELRFELESLKLMQYLAQQGKYIYSLDQEWMM